MTVTTHTYLPEIEHPDRLEAYGERDEEHQWCDDDGRNGSDDNINYALQRPTQGVKRSLLDSCQGMPQTMSTR